MFTTVGRSGPTSGSAVLKGPFTGAAVIHQHQRAGVRWFGAERKLDIYSIDGQS